MSVSAAIRRGKGSLLILALTAGASATFLLFGEVLIEVNWDWGSASAPSAMLSTVRQRVARVLQKSPRAFEYASKAFYTLNRSFSTLSPGAPAALQQAFQRTRDELVGDAGDYYEFGLFRGYTFWYAQQVCRDLDMSMASIPSLACRRSRGSIVPTISSTKASSLVRATRSRRISPSTASTGRGPR